MAGRTAALRDKRLNWRRTFVTYDPNADDEPASGRRILLRNT